MRISPAARARLAGLLVLLCLMVLVLAPLAAAFTPLWQVAAWEGVLAEGRQWNLLFRTLGLGLLATALSLLLALPAGLRMALGGRGGAMLKVLLAVPLLIPPCVHAIAWTDILSALPGATPHGLLPASLVIALNLFPVPALALAWARQLRDPEQEDAARLSGGPWRALCRVTMPALRPVLAAALGVVFFLTLVSFAVPSLLQVNVYTVEIHSRFSAQLDPAGAMAQAVPLIVVVLVPGLALAAWLRPRVQWHASTRGACALPLPAWYTWLSAVLGWAIGLTAAALPLAVLAWRAMPLGSLVTAWRSSADELVASLGVAATTATVGLVLAVLMAQGGRGAWGRAHTLCLLPLAASGPVFALGLIRLWNHAGLPALVYDHWPILPMACVGRYLAFAYLLMLAAMRHLPRTLVEAAAVSGAGPARRMVRIVLPLLRGPLVAAWGLLFVLCLHELDTILLVAPPGLSTLSIRLFTLMHYGPSQLTAALSLLLVGASLLMAGLAAAIARAASLRTNPRGSGDPTRSQGAYTSS